MNYVKTNPTKQSEQHDNFKKDLLGVLEHINGLMVKTEREFIGAQTVALKNFISIFTDLEKIFNINERSKIAIDFINSVKYDESRKILNSEKLQLILNLVESDLFLHDGMQLAFNIIIFLNHLFAEVRGVMLPTIARHLKQHLSGASPDDVLKCGKILHVIIESIQIRRKDPNTSAAALSIQITEIIIVLPEVMACIRALGRTQRARLDLIHALFSIFYLMEPTHFEKFLKVLITQDMAGLVITGVG